MKKNYMYLFTLSAAIALISWQKTVDVKVENFKKSHKYAGGAPAGKTGAPTESNCTECHTGAVQAGATENVLVVTDGTGQITSYVPGASYTVTLAMTSFPAKKGFQATALNSSNAFAGSFATLTGGGVAISSGSGKSYANHTAASTNAATFPVWAWTWTAPATDMGDVKFYVASNKTNSNGQVSGDVIYLSNHTIGSTAGIDENAKMIVKNFNASFSSETSSIYVQFASLINGAKMVNIVDMNGKSVLNMDLGTSIIGQNKETIKVPDHLKNGMYVVQFFVDNNPMSQMVKIER